METTKEEMMMLLRELQDLQMWLLNRGSKLTLAVVFGGEHFFSIIARLITDRDLAYRAVDVSERKPFNENVANLEDFMDYVTKLEYGRKKNESNHTPTGKARV